MRGTLNRPSMTTVEVVAKFNKKHCFAYPIYNKIIYSDVCSYACGALIQNAQQSICHKMFTPEEIYTSSTHGELITILYSLRAFGNNLRHNSSLSGRMQWGRMKIVALALTLTLTGTLTLVQILNLLLLTKSSPWLCSAPKP